MISKKVGISPKNDNYARLAEYVADAGHEGEKSLMHWCAGCLGDDDYQDGIPEVADVQAMNTRTKQSKTYHLVISFRQEDEAKWPGIRSIGSVTSLREQSGKTTAETRYFICSLPAEVEKFAAAVRSHWTIENSLHWVMDIVFRDDECRIRKRHGPANFVTLKHITHNMLKSLPGKMSMRVRRKRAGWDDGFLAAALRAAPE